MALTDDLNLHVELQRQSLQSALAVVPAGLPDQLAELAPVLATFDTAAAAIAKDTALSDSGKAAALRSAADVATAAVTAWRTKRTEGIAAQEASMRATLAGAVAKATPAVSDMQVSAMAQRLVTFDPLEISVLYADASDSEKRTIEAAVESLGRQPRRDHGGQVVWETLLPAERIEATRTARMEAVNPAGGAALDDLRHIRGAYGSLASAATGLLRQAIPTR